jgi:hypothetical protein
MSARSHTTTIPRGRWLLLARAIWVAIFLMAVGIFIASIPYDYDQKLQVCTAANCDVERLDPEDAEALRDLGLTERFYAAYYTSMAVVFGLSFTLVAAVILWRRSTDWMAMLVSVALVTFGTSLPEVSHALADANPEWIFPVLFVGVIGITSFFLLLFLFPDGQLVPRWTRFPAIARIALGVATFAYMTVLKGEVEESALFYGIPVVLLIGVLSQVQRYRRHSSPAQQQQAKWVVFGLTFMMLATIAGGVIEFELFDPGRPRLLGKLIGIPLLFVVPSLVVPTAVGVSILRYRLLDIDVVFNRTLVYGAITVALAIAFVGSAALFQLIFSTISGDQSPFALAGSALLIGVLFLPVRRRVRHLLDRRFYPDAARSDAPSGFGTMAMPSSPAFFRKGRYEAIDFLGEGQPSESTRSGTRLVIAK